MLGPHRQLGIVLATIYIENVRAAAGPVRRARLRKAGGTWGVGGLVFGGSVLGAQPLPTGVVDWPDRQVAHGDLARYVVHAAHARAGARPYCCRVILRRGERKVGGFVYLSRVGAMPFLLPLFAAAWVCNFSAFQAGLFTIANIVGAMGMKTIIPIALRKWGLPQGAHGMNAPSLGSATVGACARCSCQGDFVSGWLIAIFGIAKLSLAPVHKPNTPQLCDASQTPASAGRPLWSRSASNCRSRSASPSARSWSMRRSGCAAMRFITAVDSSPPSLSSAWSRPALRCCSWRLPPRRRRRARGAPRPRASARPDAGDGSEARKLSVGATLYCAAARGRRRRRSKAGLRPMRHWVPRKPVARKM